MSIGATRYEGQLLPSSPPNIVPPEGGQCVQSSIFDLVSEEGDPVPETRGGRHVETWRAPG